MTRSSRLAPLLALVLVATIHPSLHGAPMGQPAEVGETAGSPALAPWEGRWQGEASAPTERVLLGLELARAGDGLRATLTFPIANYYGLPIPTPATLEGGELAIGELGLRLRQESGALVGNLGKARLHLARVERFGPELAERRVEELPPLALERLWSTRLGGPVYATPAVENGVAYVGSAGGTFDAIDVASGALRWSFPAGRPIFGEARVTGGGVYFVADDGFLYRLDARTGKEVWRYDLGGERAPRVLPHPQVFDWDWHAPRPLTAAGAVCVGSGDGSFHAVEEATGRARWRTAPGSLGSSVRGGAASAGERVFVGGADGFLIAFDAASGTTLWRRDTGAPITTEPWTDGRLVVVGNRGIGLLAFDAASGEPRWKTTFWGSWVESTPVAAEGLLYVGSSDLRRVTALAPEDGRVLWRTDVGGWSFGRPLVLGGKILAASAGGAPYFIPHAAGIALLERATGRLLGRHPWPEVAGAHQWGPASSLVAVDADSFLVTAIEGGISRWRLAGRAASGGAMP